MPGAAHARLTEVDPDSAHGSTSTISSARRGLRSIIPRERRSPSGWLDTRSEAPFETAPWHPLGEGELRRRIAERVDPMLDRDGSARFEGPRCRGTGRRDGHDGTRLPGNAAHLRGELSMEDLRERISTSIGRFAKRQGTWFNRDPNPCGCWEPVRTSLTEPCRSSGRHRRHPRLARMRNEMSSFVLDFERPIVELEDTIRGLQELPDKSGVDVADQIRQPRPRRPARRTFSVSGALQRLRSRAIKASLHRLPRESLHRLEELHGDRQLHGRRSHCGWTVATTVSL